MSSGHKDLGWWLSFRVIFQTILISLVPVFVTNLLTGALILQLGVKTPAADALRDVQSFIVTPGIISYVFVYVLRRPIQGYKILAMESGTYFIQTLDIFSAYMIILQLAVRAALGVLLFSPVLLVFGAIAERENLNPDSFYWLIAVLVFFCATGGLKRMARKGFTLAGYPGVRFCLKARKL